MTLTQQATADHYTLTLGSVIAPGPQPEFYTKITRAYILKRIGSGSQIIELCVTVPPAYVPEVRNAFRAYFKPYLAANEKIVCYLTVRSQKINVYCQVDETTKLQPKLQNTNLEALINKLI